ALAQYAAEDSTYRSFAAETFLRAGATFIQRRDYARAVELLSRGRPWATAEMAPFYANYLGRAELQLITSELLRVSDQRDCQGARRADTVLTRVRENLVAGMSVDSQRTAMMVESVLPGYVDNARRMAEAYCRQQQPQQRPPARRRP
ncbi:MAG TPA: hypothetical protein VNL98_06135, partial [Gemmatimonadales bacterium]|nr:hypothetical protein [Gemmatimonadales bacterium]